MKNTTTTADTETLLYNLPESEFALGGEFDAAARKAGYASGKSAANDLNLWGLTVAKALEVIERE